MSFEIEIKAWVDDPEGTRELISRFAAYRGEFLREDGYWFAAGSGVGEAPGSVPPESPGSVPSGSVPQTGIRIRRERYIDPLGRLSQTVLVTYKAKEVREGLEVNDEREFEVSDGGIFAELLGRLGFKEGKTKTKHGWAWTRKGITAELTELTGLGWFAELEILADNDRPETVAVARKRLLDLLGKLNIGEEKIEARYYTELLDLKFR
ncbi:MAG: class IV adenylate cyclase [Spirochaetaceae bacterium]|jgi:adenylate cyclase class 2|nr:class IV adenylate cyclase [Spirochaetaceae bacterium]